MLKVEDRIVKFVLKLLLKKSLHDTNDTMMLVDKQTTKDIMPLSYRTGLQKYFKWLKASGAHNTCPAC